MIEVKIKTKGDTKSIEISGHAKYAEHGKDIICASVSTIFQLSLIGLQQLAKQYPNNVKITSDIEEEKGDNFNEQN